MSKKNKTDFYLLRKKSLSEGDLFVVPKGEEHKPFADKECKIILVELKGTQNTGQKTHRLTVENNQWI